MSTHFRIYNAYLYIYLSLSLSRYISFINNPNLISLTLKNTFHLRSWFSKVHLTKHLYNCMYVSVSLSLYRSASCGFVRIEELLAVRGLWVYLVLFICVFDLWFDLGLRLIWLSVSGSEPCWLGGRVWWVAEKDWERLRWLGLMVFILVLAY